MDNYRYFEAYEDVYHFIWDDLADWYLEASKTELNKALILSLLKAILVLVHPFAPFITETIWQKLISTGENLSGQAITFLREGDKEKSANFEDIKCLITNARSTIKAVQAHDITMYYHDEPLIQQNAALIKQMVKLKNISMSDSGRGFTVPGTSFNCWLDISQEKIASYVNRLDKDIEAEQATVRKLQQRINNPGYTKNAPERLVNQSRADLLAAEQKLDSYLQEKLRYKDI